jgi:hypothetical protein
MKKVVKEKGLWVWYPEYEIRTPVVRSGKKQLQLLLKCRPAHREYYFRHYFQPFMI